MDSMFEQLDPTITHQNDEDRNYLEELVGEDKKFKDIAALAKGKAYADASIEVLKRKVDELQSELNGKMNMDAFLQEMRKTRDAPVDPTPPSTPDAGSFNAQDLDSKFEEYIQRREAKVRAETNLEKVTRVMEQNFGAEAKLVVNKKAKDLGMSLKDLQDLALRSPQAFLSLVGASEQATRTAPGLPSSGLNSTSQQPTQGLRGKKFYEKMKRDDPKLYNDPKTTANMMRDAAAWGSIEAFNAN